MIDHIINPTVILAAIGPMGVDFAFRDEDHPSYYGLEHVFVALHSTFSDALMHYVKRHGLQILGAQLYIAIAGAVSPDVTKVTNGSWYLSRSGLKAMTERDPFIVNDVAAIAYAAISGNRRPFGYLTTGVTNLETRCALVWAGEGLGAAGILTTSPYRIMESEAGHLPFVPRDEAQTIYAGLHSRKYHPLSYERVIISLQDDLQLQTSDTQREATLSMIAKVLGQFCSTIITSFASWPDIIVCGQIFEKLERQGLAGTMLNACDSYLLSQRRVAGTVCSILDGRLVALRGLMTIDATPGATI